MKNRRFLVGYLILATLLLLTAPFETVWAEKYIYQILLAGPLIFVPWSKHLLSSNTKHLSSYTDKLYLFGVALMLSAFCLPSGWVAALLHTPWLLFTSYLALITLKHLDKSPFALVFAALTLPIAAAWMLADRLGWQPLGFDPLIVLLTGVHFHYAGFALAIGAALLPKNYWQNRLSLGLVPGVAGVAIGITNTQLGGPAWVEIAGVCTMVGIGIAIAFQQVRFALRLKLRTAQVTLVLGSLALMGGLSLALLYGWRFQHQWSWLTVPWMYATHGLLNSLGFSLLSFIGHTLIPQNH